MGETIIIAVIAIGVLGYALYRERQKCGYYLAMLSKADAEIDRLHDERIAEHNARAAEIRRRGQA